MSWKSIGTQLLHKDYTDEATVSISLFISMFEEVLFGIISEEVGLATIKEKIENIKIQIADKAEVIGNGANIIISVIKNENDIQYLTKDGLNNQLNNIL